MRLTPLPDGLQFLQVHDIEILIDWAAVIRSLYRLFKHFAFTTSELRI
jgi:hypothetical protein